MKFEGSGSKGTQVIERKRFSLFGSLWPWPTDPKINRGLLLNKGYQPMKFKGSGSKGTRVIERKRFSLFGSLWPSKSLGFFNSISAITLWSLKALAQMVLVLLSGNGFHSLGHCDHGLWPTDLKINRGLLLNKGYHLWSLKALAQRVLKLLSGNGFHSSGLCDLDLWPTDPKSYWAETKCDRRTDSQTNRLTDGQTDKAKTICLSFTFPTSYLNVRMACKKYFYELKK